MSSPNTEALGLAKAEVEILEPDHAQFYQEMGYTGVLRLEGKIVGIMQFIFTYGICVGLDEYGYEYRFCYHDFPSAATALAEWIRDGGDEPTGYIKRK